EQYGVVLERGELRLHFEEGAFSIHYYEHTFPVAPKEYAAVLRHDLETLQTELGAQSDAMIELESILTAVDHLPPAAELEDSARVERNREKEVIKRRLKALCESSAEVAAFVERNVAHFNGLPGSPRSFDPLDRVLEGCAYRLAHWRVAGEEINY